MTTTELPVAETLIEAIARNHGLARRRGRLVRDRGRVDDVDRDDVDRGNVGEADP